MKKIFLIFVLTSLTIFSQKEESKVGFNFSGFVKTDIFYDSRQTVSFREGHFSISPLPVDLDTNGNDINAKSNFNMISIQTRLTGRFTGPEAFGAASSAVVEAEFFGTSEADVNGLRLRHAFLNLDWENVSLLVGQTWHPMFVIEMFPGVVSFNAGAPFQPFSRNPQLRLSYSIDKLKLIASAVSQRDFPSDGPIGFSSSYLRNAVIPNLNFQLQYNSEGKLFGAGVDYKRIQPRLVTTKRVATDEVVESISFIGYTRLNLNPFVLKAEAVYGSNMSDQIMLGGYGVTKNDPVTGKEEYSPINTLSVWGEIIYGKEIELGLFGGYAKNLGADKSIVGPSFGRGLNIDNLFRISPRVQFNSGKARISAEVEFTSADYGSPNWMNKGKIENIKNVSNVRVLTAFFYFF